MNVQVLHTVVLAFLVTQVIAIGAAGWTANNKLLMIAFLLSLFGTALNFTLSYFVCRKRLHKQTENSVLVPTALQSVAGFLLVIALLIDPSSWGFKVAILFALALVIACVVIMAFGRKLVNSFHAFDNQSLNIFHCGTPPFCEDSCPDQCDSADTTNVDGCLNHFSGYGGASVCMCPANITTCKSGEKPNGQCQWKMQAPFLHKTKVLILECSGRGANVYLPTTDWVLPGGPVCPIPRGQTQGQCNPGPTCKKGENCPCKYQSHILGSNKMANFCSGQINI